MYSTAVAIFLVILVAALQSSEPPERPFPYRIPLDPDGILELSWNISYVQEIIHFQLEVRGLRAGVLFGMSDRGEMENADLIILWTDGNRSYFAVSPLLLRYPALMPVLPCWLSSHRRAPRATVEACLLLWCMVSLIRIKSVYPRQPWRHTH